MVQNNYNAEMDSRDKSHDKRPSRDCPSNSVDLAPHVLRDKVMGGGGGREGGRVGRGGGGGEGVWGGGCWRRESW